MLLKPLTVGPIVGATSHDSVRLWGRGELELFHGRPRWCYGVAQLRKPRGRKFLLRKILKLPAHFDMSGVAVFTGLQPNTTYDYQFAYFFSEVEVERDMFSGMTWDAIDIHRFTTASNDANATRNLVVGSCRYLLCLFGGNVFDERGDKTFRSISQQIQQRKERGEATHQVLMMGDQIYADGLRSLQTAVGVDQFFTRYRAAFSQPYIRRLMSGIPCYMMLDDHEVEDDWPQKANDEDWQFKFPSAIHAYLCYQASHGPLFELSGEDRITGTPHHYWYSYQDGCCDFFFSDTRTERDYDQEARKIMSETQLEALMGWLAQDNGRVKVIISTVPFFPDIKNNQKHWGGFPEQRAILLDWIIENNIRRVVFLSGDIHLSMSAEMVSERNPQIKIISVISSAFFWPYPRSPLRKILTHGTITSQTHGKFQVRPGLPACKQSNFVRLSISPKDISVEIFSRKGKPMDKGRHVF